MKEVREIHGARAVFMYWRLHQLEAAARWLAQELSRVVGGL